MLNLPKEYYKKILVVSALTAISAVSVFIFLKYLLVPFLPFIIAWITAMLIRPLINSICEITKFKRRIISFTCVFLLFLIILTVLVAICNKATSEIKGLAEDIMAGASDVVSDVFDYAEELSDKLPFYGKTENQETAELIRKTATSMVENAVSAFSAKIPEAIINFIAQLPSIILFTVVLVMATFYMGSDIEKINSTIISLIPQNSRQSFIRAKRKLVIVGTRYIKAYLLILFIVFVQLLIGFLCLKIPYALTLALIIAVIDILPVIGVGSVLVPWAIVLLIRHETSQGIGLLILFAVIWLVRQIIEPKIVGRSTGLHPLITLIAMYIGLNFMGVLGLFVFPMIIILIKSITEKPTDTA